MSDTTNKEVVPVSKQQLRQLLDQKKALEKENLELKTDINHFLKIIKGFLHVIGLANEKGQVHTKYLKSEEEGGENPMPVILKSVGGVVSDMTTSQIPGRLGRRAKEKVAEKFSFIQDVEPLVEKYANK